jgi:hypothetical protein
MFFAKSNAKVKSKFKEAKNSKLIFIFVISLRGIMIEIVVIVSNFGIKVVN